MKTQMLTQELGQKIEAVVRECLADVHREIQAAVDRALAVPARQGAKPPARAEVRRRAPASRRDRAEVAALGERFYEAVNASPGESMAVLAKKVGSTPSELHRPVSNLKRAGRVRSVGQRQRTRYFPMTGNQVDVAPDATITA